MGQLEEGFDKLHWPPVLIDGLHVPLHQCIKCVWIKNFKDLNIYFSAICGPDWKSQEWAKYWIGQHEQTKHDDRKEYTREVGNRVTPHNSTGPRRDSALIRQLIFRYLSACDTLPSTRAVMKYLLSTYGIVVWHTLCWRYIKQWKLNPDIVHIDIPVGLHMQQIFTPLGNPVPEGYTKKQWRIDWNKRYGIG